MIGWFTLSMQETNQWATDCSLSLHDGPWQKKKKKFCRPLQCVGPPGKCPVCPITSPALTLTHLQTPLSFPFLLHPPRVFISPFHTARWSRKIARKLPECLLCERKHIPGLIPGLIPGWGPSNIAGFSPGMRAV